VPLEPRHQWRVVITYTQQTHSIASSVALLDSRATAPAETTRTALLSRAPDNSRVALLDSRATTPAQTARTALLSRAPYTPAQTARALIRSQTSGILRLLRIRSRRPCHVRINNAGRTVP
jgi:hypothetical protein